MINCDIVAGYETAKAGSRLVTHIADALVRIAAYALTHRDAIESIDINPFIVLPKGQGAVAVDALIVQA